MFYFIGIDIAKFKHTACVLDQNGASCVEPGISLLTHLSGLMDIPFPFYPTGIRRSKTFVRIEIVNVYLSPFPEA